MSEKRKVTMDDALEAGDGVIMTARRLRIEELEAQRDELLEALEATVSLLEKLGHFSDNSLTVVEAHAAIAKAKGEEHELHRTAENAERRANRNTGKDGESN